MDIEMDLTPSLMHETAKIGSLKGPGRRAFIETSAFLGHGS